MITVTVLTSYNFFFFNSYDLHVNNLEGTMWFSRLALQNIAHLKHNIIVYSVHIRNFR